MEQTRVKGISVCNPVEIDKEYLLYTVEYAAHKGFDHLQVIGPIHDVVKGNIDGMTPYRKYHLFDEEKCQPYIEHCLDAVNAACERAAAYHIKTYMWHHELELPSGFKEQFPEVVNGCGDVEVTHPLVKDFLEHKLMDFFNAYPHMDGIILTLHETKIPLLKLKEQKLGKTERVKYVTGILFETCKSLGKELIVRPFASIEEDYEMMAKAYEEISTEMWIMDKWTQFDWSLTLPHNSFYHKIKKNPLFVEADIFGEFFGKGFLPLMLKEHIAEKFAYCEGFEPKGYVARIDRAGQIPFGDVNEVNINIMHAYLNHSDVEHEIQEFFEEKYPNAADEVRSIMEQTEEILKKTFYANGYYFTELSLFPTLNHCKNHYYFEMMREKYDIASDEWYIPRGWKRGSLKGLVEEKENAVKEAAALLERLSGLEDRIEKKEYEKLWTKFCNLKLITEIWLTLLKVFQSYAAYFETYDPKYEAALEKEASHLLKLNEQGKELLGIKFYLQGIRETVIPGGLIEDFAQEVCTSFKLEKEALARLEQEQTVDFIVCGGALEGHRLQKEVNFSDTLILDHALCRIPGNKRGMEWSSINAHGWFSYEIKVKPRTENRIRLVMSGGNSPLDIGVTIGETKHRIQSEHAGKGEYEICFTEYEGKERVRIRFDKLSKCTPCVFEIIVCK
ncbi:MAG: hypothetical protein IKK59_06190 [Lachnospiraceae bacterium]|nr:hypothetical protein [Lachnospiraceae bacterium]